MLFRATIGSPAKRHLNGVLLAGRQWRAFILCILMLFMSGRYGLHKADIDHHRADIIETLKHFINVASMVFRFHLLFDMFHTGICWHGPFSMIVYVYFPKSLIYML